MLLADAQILNKMKRTIYRLMLIFAVSAGLCSCNGFGDKGAPNVAGEITLHDLNSENWTYFSFEKGEVVGTGKFGDAESDAQWHDRKDWDFAICGDRIKTNSGASGVGQGGIQKENSHNFATLTTAPTDGYITDEMQIIR